MRRIVADQAVAARHRPSGPRFRDELLDFFHFIFKPRFGTRLPGRHAVSGWWEDWFPGLSVGRLLKWAIFLWAVNLVFLGDRKSVVSGKVVYVGVDLGGRRSLKKIK